MGTKKVTSNSLAIEPSHLSTELYELRINPPKQTLALISTSFRLNYTNVILPDFF